MIFRPCVFIKQFGLFCFFGFVLVSAMQAYGPTGHRVVGKIAEEHLSTGTLAAVQEILGKESLAEVSTWADWIKSDPEWRHANPWHYVNIPEGGSYEESPKNPAGDAYVKLLEFVEVLSDDARPIAERREALKWIVHLVGDLHQPLHVGHAEDRGGNSNKAMWFGESSNLHRIWDSGLIDSKKMSYTEFAESIDRRYDPRIESGPKIDLDLWIEEALELRIKAYEEPEPSYGGSFRYVFEKMALLEEQLKKGGLRLALLLESIFGDETAAAGTYNMSRDLHWMRNSAEYQALTRQVYQQATNRLLQLKSDGVLAMLDSWAVSLDADETILDNSLFAKEQQGAPFDPAAWDDWCRRSEAPAVPGAVEFTKLVKELGGKVAIVTNRSIRTKAETEANLRALGVDYDVALLKDKTSNKNPRWDLLEKGEALDELAPVELIMFIGDNIRDFPNSDQSLRDSDDSAYSNFGIQYFVLPNPTYGSFEKNGKL